MTPRQPPDPDFENLIRYIQESRGLDFRGYKRTSLQRRIALRMKDVDVEDFESYQAFLEVHPQEFVELLEEGLFKDIGVFALHPVQLDEVITAMCATAGRFIEPAPLAAALGMSTAEVAYLLERMADAGIIDPRRGLVDPLLHQLPALHDPTAQPPSERHVAAFTF